MITLFSAQCLASICFNKTLNISRSIIFSRNELFDFFSALNVESTLFLDFFTGPKNSGIIIRKNNRVALTISRIFSKQNNP